MSMNVEKQMLTQLLTVIRTSSEKETDLLLEAYSSGSTKHGRLLFQLKGFGKQTIVQILDSIISGFAPTVYEMIMEHSYAMFEMPDGMTYQYAGRLDGKHYFTELGKNRTLVELDLESPVRRLF